MRQLGVILSIIGLFALFAFMPTSKVITGTVTNNEGNPIAGATVKVKNQQKFATITNRKGTYKLTVPDNAKTLVFSFGGMPTIEKTIGTKTVVDAVLSFETPELLIEIEEIEDMEEGYEKVFMIVEKSKKRAIVGCAVSGNFDRPYVEHNTESYDVINENIFKSPLNEPLSTFSADVDRAAYANMRRFVTGSQMPPKDAVRIEEFINYFDYDYPQPKGDDPFSITMEMGACSWNKDHYLMSIGLKGRELEVKSIPASNLVFLLDVSGSMSSPNKLPLLKQAFSILLDNLRGKDKVAIVVYAGAAGVVLRPTSCDKKKTILNAMNKLSAGGSTAGGDGIKLAYKLAKENFIKGGNNRVILATDGDFNIGASSDAEMVRLIENKRDDDIFLTVLGFGMGNYKDSKMEKLSNAGNGNYAYIDNILEAKKTLGKEIWGTLFTIAKDVKIQIEFNPAKVKGYRLIGYENRMLNAEDFNDDKKDAGEIGAGHSVTAVYEIIPAGSDEKIKGVDELEYQNTKVVKSKNLATVKLRYKKPDGIVSKLITQRIKEDDIKKTDMSQNYRFVSAVIEFGLLLRDSEFKKNASYTNVIKRAKKAKGSDDDGFRAEFIRLVEAAELLSK